MVPRLGSKFRFSCFTFPECWNYSMCHQAQLGLFLCGLQMRVVTKSSPCCKVAGTEPAYFMRGGSHLGCPPPKAWLGPTSCVTRGQDHSLTEPQALYASRGEAGLGDCPSPGFGAIALAAGTGECFGEQSSLSPSSLWGAGYWGDMQA